jgi:cytochrome c oxidase subunit 2
MPVASSFSKFIFTLFNTVTYLDSAEPWQMGFQDPATPTMEGIINLHHDLMFVLIVVLVMVLWLLYRILTTYNRNEGLEAEKTVHATNLEIVWTVTPGLILIMIAIPSFALLYKMDEMVDPSVTMKIIGHQWYWSYEFSDANVREITGGGSVRFDSYIMKEKLLGTGHLRLLEVTNRVVLPYITHIRLIITSADVLHCWAVPSFGIKMDACPGRLNQLDTFVKRAGIFFGQCSEICGVQHGFMPIVVEAANPQRYVGWLIRKI